MCGPLPLSLIALVPFNPESPAIATPDETRESWLSRSRGRHSMRKGEEKLEERVNADSAKSARSKVRHVTAAPKDNLE